jgi:hypothetical protein
MPIAQNLEMEIQMDKWKKKFGWVVLGWLAGCAKLLEYGTSTGYFVISAID